MVEKRKLRDGEYVEFTHGWGQLRYALGLIKSFVQGRNHRIVYGDPRSLLGKEKDDANRVRAAERST